MKIDVYTKAVLTVIAVLLAVLAFDRSPTKEAQAQGRAGNEMVTATEPGSKFAHMWAGKVRLCFARIPNTLDSARVICSDWK